MLHGAYALANLAQQAGLPKWVWVNGACGLAGM